MQTKNVIIFIAITAIIALALGTTVGYNISSGKTMTLTQSVTDSSTVVVIQSVTTTSITTMSPPKIITINGTVETEFYEPVEVAFRVCYYGNLSGILGSEFCGNQNYSSPVTNIVSWNNTGTLPPASGNQYFNGTYSVRVPNNSTYDLYLAIRVPTQANSTSNYDKVDVIRLPIYSASPNITNYRIGCTYEGVANSYYACFT